jgi:predicted amidophosphoribosyltransferase
MRKLSPSLAALDQHLKAQNRKPTWQSRCLGCQQQFTASEAMADICPKCKRDEDKQFAPDEPADLADDDLQARPWSRAAMRERLGVCGDVDE